MYVFLRKNEHFSINRHSKTMPVCPSILEPTSLLFGFKNQPKLNKNRLRKGINFLIDFGTVFSLILDPFWTSSWAHVGSVFAQESPPEAPGAENPLKSAPPEPPLIFHRFASSSKRVPGRLRDPSGAPPGGGRGGSGDLLEPFRGALGRRRAGLGVCGGVEGKSVEAISGYVRRGSEERVRLLPHMHLRIPRTVPGHHTYVH